MTSSSLLKHPTYDHACAVYKMPSRTASTQKALLAIVYLDSCNASCWEHHITGSA